MKRVHLAMAVLALSACRTDAPPAPETASPPEATSPANTAPQAAGSPANEKRDVVAQYFFDAAEKFYRETKYQEARESLLEAVKLQPRADLVAKAQSLLREVEELLGIGGSSEAGRLDQEVAIHNVKVSQAVQKVQVLMEEGRADLALNRFDEGQRKINSAREILRGLPRLSSSASRQGEAQPPALPIVPTVACHSSPLAGVRRLTLAGVPAGRCPAPCRPWLKGCALFRRRVSANLSDRFSPRARRRRVIPLRGELSAQVLFPASRARPAAGGGGAW
ncbi:MAG: hypothetical protein HY720_06185 [Planctomycetes bacterium]|nr:hypothetical protein [Planctomycetota bacterium]